MTYFLYAAAGLAGLVGMIAAANAIRSRVVFETITVGDHLQFKDTTLYCGRVLSIDRRRSRFLMQSLAGHEFFVDMGRVELWKAKELP